MKKFALVGAVSMLAVLASCGGGGSDTLSNREYVRSLEDICNDVDSDLRDIADPEDYDEIADAADEAVSIIDDALADFKELKPPKDFQEDHDDFVAAVEDLSSGFEDLKDAADDEDDDAIEDAADTLQQASDDADEIADSIGADDCVGVGNDSDEPTPGTQAPDPPATEGPVTVPPITESPATEAPETVPATQPPATQPPVTQVTVPPIEMTMPPQTEPPVSGTSIETFDFNNLITPPGYSWENIDPATLADIQADFDAQFMGQIAALGGARVTDAANGFTFNTFVFFWNEADIVASGTGINFLDQFTNAASTSSDTFTQAGFPVTIWTDPDGLEGVGVIDSDVSVVMYGPSGTTQQMLTFFDSFILVQG